MLRGHVDWWAGKEVYEVPHHHVYVTRPDEWHGGVDSVLHPCELFWIGIRIPKRGALPGLSAQLTAGLLGQLAAIRERVSPAPSAITNHYWAVLVEHRERGLHAAVAARAATHGLLVAVLRAYERHEAGLGENRNRISAGTQAAMDLALGNLSQRVAVDNMARAAQHSVSRFHARFVQETGRSPADWLRHQRVREAKRLLLTTRRSIVTLANDLGFPSSQYFATVFSQHTGLSPSAYRKRGETAGT